MAVIALIILVAIGIFWLLVAIGYGTFLLIRFCYRAWRDALGFSPQARFIRRFKKVYPLARIPLGENELEPDVLHNIAELVWIDKQNCKKEMGAEYKRERHTHRYLTGLIFDYMHPDFLTMIWIRNYFLSRRPHPHVMYHILCWLNNLQDTNRAYQYSAQHYEITFRFIEGLKVLMDPKNAPTPIEGAIPEDGDVPYLSQIQLGFR